MIRNSLDRKITLGIVACFGGGGGGGTTSAATVPDESDAEVQAAKEKERKLARLRKGRSSTILTSGQGLGDNNSNGKTLLGA
jgi:hypothetical protein